MYYLTVNSYWATITRNGVNHYLGCFLSAEAAALCVARSRSDDPASYLDELAAAAATAKTVAAAASKAASKLAEAKAAGVRMQEWLERIRLKSAQHGMLLESEQADKISLRSLRR